MYSELPADIRDRHPYHMYEEIKAQPAAVARSLALAERGGSAICDVVAMARRVFVTGCGTSFHAAQVGASMLQAWSAGAIDARAIQAYELVTYFSGLSDHDAVLALSHSGATTMSIRALEQANEQGAATVAITGFPESKIAAAAGLVLQTGYGDERSWAHTISYTAALASLAGLANQLAEPSRRLDLAALPDVMAETLQLEEICHRLAGGVITAARYREPAGTVIVGGGPNAATAREGVLKLLETSYGWATGWELEQMLHGPLAATTAETLFIILAPPGRSTDRAVQLVRAIDVIGATPIVLVGSENADRFEETHRLLLPDTPEVLSPLLYVVPLQLFSYFLAVGHGRNPDLIHRDDETYRAASAAYD